MLWVAQREPKSPGDRDTGPKMSRRMSLPFAADRGFPDSPSSIMAKREFLAGVTGISR
jgi:hypothetical protein